METRQRKPKPDQGTLVSPEAFMNPESCDAGLGIMEVLVGSKHALEDLGREAAMGWRKKRCPQEFWR